MSLAALALAASSSSSNVVYQSSASANSIYLQEIGMPNGTQWSATYNGITLNAVAPNPIAINGTDSAVFGLSSFSANTIYGILTFFPNQSSVSATAGENAIVSFSVNTIFTENGLPDNSIWNVVFNGIESNALAPNAITFSTYPGVYNFSVGNATYNSITYSPKPAGITINAGTTLNVQYALSANTLTTVSTNNITTTFSENGLPANTQWNAVYNGITQNATAPNTIAFSTLAGNYMFSVPNAIAGNSIYIPTPQNGYIIAGNSTTIYFTLQTMTSSTSTSTPISTALPINLKNNRSILKAIMNNSLEGSIFVSNNSIVSTYENGTVANIIAPVTLNYQEMNALVPLNRSQLQIINSLLSSPGYNETVFVENISVPYGKIFENKIYKKAGSILHYVAYNTHGIVTDYNVSITKATPRLAIHVNGATLSAPNTVSKIYVPILPGQKKYNISLSLVSSLIEGNTADYSYRILFSNGTSIVNTINTSSVNYSNTFVLPSNENATITFDVGGNANYTAVDPGVIVIPSSIAYYMPLTLSNSQSSATPAPFQYMLPANSLKYDAYEANNLDNIEFFYANGNVIPSWMEGSASNTLLNNPANSIYFYTSSNTIYWLNISNGIAASNSITIYMG
ncbi:MAG: hypothetical protein QXR73_02875, partial [Candidatus Micrarchaeaceae archaeon]